MKIALTGATGFVGSYVLHQAIERGHDVAFIHRAGADFWRIADIVGRATAIVGDLAKPETYTAALQAFAPDVVLHLAWDGVGNKDRNDPRQKDNVPAARALLAASNARHFIGLGSQAEYGPCSNVIDEHQETNPTTLYGESKLAACMECAIDASERAMTFSWLRLFSSYGPKDSPDWVISYLTLALLRGHKPSLTACEQKWDFIHVRDVAAALIAVAETKAPGIFNLASGVALPLKDTVTFLRDSIDPSLPLGIGEVPYRPDQVMHLEGNITKLKNAASWAPEMALHDGLRETVDWYRANLSRYNV